MGDITEEDIVKRWIMGERENWNSSVLFWGTGVSFWISRLMEILIYNAKSS